MIVELLVSVLIGIFAGIVGIALTGLGVGLLWWTVAYLAPEPAEGMEIR